MQCVVALLLALTPQAWAFATQHHVTQNIHGSVAGALDSDDFLKREAEEETQRLANQMDKETDPKESLLQKPAWLDYVPSWLQPSDKKADKKAEAEEDEAEDDTKKAPEAEDDTKKAPVADGPSPAPAPEAASGPSAAPKKKKAAKKEKPAAKKEKPAAKKEKPAAKKEKPAAKKAKPGPVQGADAKRRIETVAHLKEPGEGYQKGSPLYKKQERLADQKDKKGAAPAKSSAVQHLPLLCLWAAAATFFAQL